MLSRASRMSRRVPTAMSDDLIQNKNACDCDQCECKNTDDYTEENGTCEDCFRDCQITEGGE